MRVLAAIAAALVLAPAAAAARPPMPLHYDGAGLYRLTFHKHKKSLISCTLQSKSHSAVAKASRKLHPVSCEQPPRVDLSGITGSITAILGGR